MLFWLASNKCLHTSGGQPANGLFIELIMFYFQHINYCHQGSVIEFNYVEVIAIIINLYLYLLGF